MISLVTLLVLSGAPKLVATPFCEINASMVLFHVNLPLKWREKSGTSHVTDMIFQMRCFKNSRECSGIVIHETNKVDSQGNPTIGFYEMEPMTEATLQSLAGDVAVIQWGVHQFVFDAVAGTITKTTRGSTDRGVGRCPKGSVNSTE